MSKWKFQQIEPQPARGTLHEGLWDDPDWIAEEKYDGDRRIAQFCGKIVRFTGRRKSVKDGLFVEKTENVPHLSNRWTGRLTATECGLAPTPGHLAALEGTVLDGEMVCPPDPVAGCYGGGLSKYVTSIMGSLPEEAVRKQIERGWLRYVVFDILFLKGKDLRGAPLRVRQHHLSDVVSAWGNPFVSQAERSTTAKRAMYDRIVKAGGEGVILKALDHKYGDKALWVKVKKIATYDVVIIGFKPAKETSRKVNGTVSRTKYAGKVGSVEIGQQKEWVDGNGRGYDLISMGYARGFSDRLMDEFTRHPNKYLGKVITVEANDREPTGKFRHPRVTDPENPFRTDKAAKDCVYREGES